MWYNINEKRGGILKTYIFNTNFSKEEEASDQLITKQHKFMLKCQGQIAISSTKSLYNYNDDLNYTGNHIKSLCYGLYVEDATGNVRIDKHFPKTKALFIATMWAEKDIYVIAGNGFYNHGKYFTSLLKDESDQFMKDLYSLDSIYLIYLKGDERANVLLESFYVEYDAVHDLTIVSYGKLQPENVLKIIAGYTFVYSDQVSDLELLNSANKGYAIGNQFELAKLGPNVDHTGKYYFINKYIELYM